jgi:Zn-dependent protease
MTGLTLGRVFGTEVRAHWSWIFILAFVAVIFGIDLTDGSAARWPAALAWGSSIAVAALVFASVTFHELAHVNVARRNGQNIPVVVVQLLGGPYIMEVKPTAPTQELRIALAGPAVSLAVAVAFGLVASLFAFGPLSAADVPDSLQAVGFVTTLVATFNLFVCVVNLIPGYPLDGARVVHALVWRFTQQESVATAAAIRIGRYVGVALVAGGAVALLVVDPAAGLCLIIGGWLIMSSSRFLDRRKVLQDLLVGMHVSDAQDTEPARVPPQLTLDVFADEYLGERLGAAALVERGSDVLGLIGTAQVRRVPRQKWTLTRTEDAMVGIEKVPTVAAEADLWSALEVLERTGLDAVLVAAGAPGTTLMTRRSAAKLVHERAEERHRELLALGQVRKSRFRGR